MTGLGTSIAVFLAVGRCACRSSIVVFCFGMQTDNFVDCMSKLIQFAQTHSLVSICRYRSSSYRIKWNNLTDKTNLNAQMRSLQNFFETRLLPGTHCSGGGNTIYENDTDEKLDSLSKADLLYCHLWCAQYMLERTSLGISCSVTK